MKLNELKAEVVRNEMTLEELAERVNMTRTTLWRRFNNPDEFTLSEITNIATELNLDGQRVVEIFFEEKVS